MSRKSVGFYSPTVRLQVNGAWEALTFMLNGLVFVLIGLQLPYVLAGINGRYTTWTLAFYGVVFSVVLILLRLVWVFPAVKIASLIDRKVLRHAEEDFSPREVFVVGWTGMRGVLALAAAISLPRTLDNGSPFPQREVIIFLTFCVILVTLVVQGLTLPSLIRKLGLSEADPLETVEREARKRMLRGALDYLESLDSAARPDEAVWLDVLHHYKERYAMVEGHPKDVGDPTPGQWTQMYDLNSRVRAAERAALVKMRYEDRISDHVLRKLERELDLLDTRFVPRG
jgi:CPA1 family monovalent cation:H+ antiporter